MKKIAENIPGYTYGNADVARSPVTLQELKELEQSVGFTSEDRQYLRLAGEVLGDQTEALVNHWRGILGKSAHLAKHSKSPDGEPIPEYSQRSGLRFEQWILDTCLRPYDQQWLDYQQEIALRHTSLKKNKTDQVHSTPFVPLRHVIAFWAVINETVRPFLAKKGHSDAEIDLMHRAWCKSTQLQAALWAMPYTDGSTIKEW